MTRLTLFSVRNRALIALTTVFAVLAGLWSATALPRELFPSLEFPVLAVATPVPGASAVVVEEQVSAPMEFAAQRLSGVVEVTSTSSDGFSAVTIELDYGTDLGNAQTDLQRSVLAVQDLPDGAEPQVFAGSLDDFPIIALSATGGEDPADLVRRLKELVVPDLEDIDGVRGVQLTGVADRVVQVKLDEQAAAAAGVTAPGVGQLLQANGVVTDAGSVRDGNTELAVQVGSRLTSVQDIAALPLVAPTGSPDAPDAGEPPSGTTGTASPAAPGPLTLGDVAQVRLADQEATAYTRTDGQPSIGLQVTRTPEGNAVEISHDIEAMIPELEEVLAGGELTIIFDQAPFIEQSIEDLTTEGLLGLSFAILVVLVFLLSVRLTLVTALSIPLSLLTALLGLKVFGYSLNIFTLGALTIAIGRVVDDSIVVIENIKRHMAMGKERREAIVTAVQEVAGAITSATAATVAVFLPLALVGGQVGELFRPFAFTVAIAMLASLLVALTIVPVLGYWLLPRSGGSADTGASAQELGADPPDRLQRAYLPVLTRSLRHPVITLALAGLVLVGTGVGATALKTDFIGGSGEDTLTATLGMPSGTALEDTDAAAREVEAWLTDQESVQSYQATVGSSGGIESVFIGGGSSTATFAITLAQDGAGDMFGDTMEADAPIPDDAQLSVAGSTQQPGASTLEVVVSAADPTELAQAADQVVGVVEAAGATDISNNLSETLPSLQVQVDRPAAAAVGLTEAQVGQVVSSASTGATVGQVSLGAATVPVVVQQGEPPQDVAGLQGVVVGADPQGPTTVADVASVRQVEEPVQITRIDGQRSATIEASPSGDDLGALTADLEQRILRLDVPDGVEIDLGGVSADQAEAFANLGLALLAAIAIVYLVMVATFNSLLQPLLLLVSVPFAATGSLAMLLVTDTPLDVAAMIGMLLLIGIVVTNAIVLIDLINQYRARGADVREAVIQGARHRFRPIVMTALATICALTPMAFSVTGGGAFISQPLALVVIGGLVSSTALTLILVPVLYQLVERGKQRLAQRRLARRGKHTQDAPAREPEPVTV